MSASLVEFSSAIELLQSKINIQIQHLNISFPVTMSRKHCDRSVTGDDDAPPGRKRARTDRTRPCIHQPETPRVKPLPSVTRSSPKQASQQLSDNCQLLRPGPSEKQPPSSRAAAAVCDARRARPHSAVTAPPAEGAGSYRGGARVGYRQRRDLTQ